MHKTLPCALALGAFMLAAPCLAGDIDFDARLHLDYASHHAGAALPTDRLLVRRAKFGIEGGLGQDWSFELSYDFANVCTLTDAGAACGNRFDHGIDDAGLTYKGWQVADIRFGQFKLPFGLEESTSSNAIDFIERALPTNAFAPPRQLGVGLLRQRAHHTLSMAAFHSSIDGEDGGQGLAARATWAPINDRQSLVHFGASVISGKPAHAVDIDARPESAPTDLKLVNTGKLEHVRRTRRIGLETAWKQGPLSLQGEWMQTFLQRDPGFSDARLDGWYVMGSWILSGGTREYRNGEFKGLQGKQPGGTWQLTARYSQLDLDNGQVRGGREHNATVGLNYHVNRHWRLMANYIRVDSERRGISRQFDILLVRLQVVL